MNIPSIETPHLILRGWKPGDAEAWHQIVQEEDILEYFPNPNPPERQSADKYIQHHQGHWKSFGYGHWAVVTKDDFRIVGWTGLEYLAELQQTELAYLLSRRVWGRGCATEAARAAITFGFEAVKLGEIVGLVHPHNVASVRVLEKCGMRLADRVTVWGLDMMRYRIRRADFEELQMPDESTLAGPPG